MQTNSTCYQFDSKSKEIKIIQLLKDTMNDGYLPKPKGCSYIDPVTIKLADNETLVLADENLKTERWQKTPFYVGKKLYNKTSKRELIIADIGVTTDSYPDYTDKEIPGDASIEYYSYDNSLNDWVFNLNRYKNDVLKQLSQRCYAENERILPTEKKMNIIVGSPASDKYSKAGITIDSISKLNNIYQAIAEKAKIDIESSNSKNEVDEVIDRIVFPSETEILDLILK